MSKLRVGVVGLGGNGRAFVKGYHLSDRAELAGLCDFSSERIAMAKEHAGVSGSVGAPYPAPR